MIGIKLITKNNFPVSMGNKNVITIVLIKTQSFNLERFLMKIRT